MSFGQAIGRDLWANAQKRSLKTHFPFSGCPRSPLRIANSIKHYIIRPRLTCGGGASVASAIIYNILIELDAGRRNMVDGGWKWAVAKKQNAF